MGYWDDSLHFFRQFRAQTRTTGSVLPSSRSLARALTQPARLGKRPRRILEAGPGTGAVTAELVALLEPGDRLDLAEINSAFVAHLQRRFAAEPAFQARQSQCRILHRSVQEIEGEHDYDFIVSGLPLNNFDLALVEQIFGAFQRLLAPAGTLSYFEYLALRRLKFPLRAQERRRVRELSQYLDEKIRRWQTGATWVLWNFPPAVARHMRFQE